MDTLPEVPLPNPRDNHLRNLRKGRGRSAPAHLTQELTSSATHSGPTRNTGLTIAETRSQCGPGLPELLTTETFTAHRRPPMATSLSDMLRKDFSNNWLNPKEDHWRAFEELKARLILPPILALTKANWPYITDAYWVGNRLILWLSVGAPVRAVLRDWCRAVRPAVGSRPGGSHHQTSPDCSWSILGYCWRETRRANEKGVGELRGCHPEPRTSQSNGRPR